MCDRYIKNKSYFITKSRLPESNSVGIILSAPSTTPPSCCAKSGLSIDRRISAVQPFPQRFQFLYVFYLTPPENMSGNVFKCVLVFELLLVTTNCDVSTRVKRGDIDLQTCIDNFNVHRDKIIRTQDSQNMGAKYLSETDLGSREECLRLCCETVNCDVFVFEEKVSMCLCKQIDFSITHD